MRRLLASSAFRHPFVAVRVTSALVVMFSVIVQWLHADLTYFNHKVKGAIQAEDIQALLNACEAAGGLNPTLCSPFTRGAGSQLNPPRNLLQNLANITTSGADVKIDWLSRPFSLGHFSAALQATRVNDYIERLRRRHLRSAGCVLERPRDLQVLKAALRAVLA